MPALPVDRTTVTLIFRTLRGRFGSAFIDRYRSGDVAQSGPDAGKDIGLLETMDVWAHELADLTPGEIQHALSHRFAKVPSCDDFILAARQRDVRPQEQFDRSRAISAPVLSREEANKRMAELTSTRLANGGKMSHRERELLIADEIARGVYQGGLWSKRQTARYLQSIGELPAHMTRFLTEDERGAA